MDWQRKFTKFIGSETSVVLHTIFFVVMFVLPFFGISFNTVLLVLTTLVSLEAIYLAIFIQMTVNENTVSLEEVEQDIDEIQENVEEIQENVDEISIDIDEIESGIDEMQEEEGEDTYESDLDNIENMLKKLIEEVEKLKANK